MPNANRLSRSEHVHTVVVVGCMQATVLAAVHVAHLRRQETRVNLGNGIGFRQRSYPDT
jgi:hypothetical protein